MIKKVDVNSGVYYIYDFTKANGDRKRLYAKTEEEILRKIDYTKREEKLYLSIYKSKSICLIECIKHYIDNFSLSKIPKTQTKQLKTLFSILNYSCLEKSIYDIECDEIQNIFNGLSKWYSVKTVNRIYEIFKDTFKVYDIDFFEIQSVSYNNFNDIEVILSPNEYNLMINFCKQSLKFGKKREIILFSLLTGIPFSFLFDLKKKHINLDLNKCEKDGKIYPLNLKAKEWIIENFKYYRQNDYLFLNERGDFITLPLVCQTINRIAEILYLPYKVTSKTINKSFTVWCKYYNIMSNDILIDSFGYSQKRLAVIQDEYLKRKQLLS